MRTRIAAASLGFAMLCSQHGASAQVTAADHEAQARFREGSALIAAGHPEEGRIKFAQAYAVTHKLNALWNLALAETDSHHPLDALQHFREWLDDPRSAGNKLRDEANDLIAKVRAQTAHLTVAGAATNSLLIDGKEAGLQPPQLRVNGVFDVEPGHHVLEVSPRGGALRREVDVEAGASVTIHFEEPTPPAVLAVAPSPSTPAALPDAAAAASTQHEFWTPRTTLAVGLGAAAVVAFGVGVGVGLTAKGRRDDIATIKAGASCSTGCTDLDDKITSQRRNTLVANVSYAGAALLAAGSLGVVTSLYFSPDKTSPNVARVAPVFLSGGGGFVFDGRF
jgi:hypothetical protein